jgi:hypothetical protein
MQYFRTTAARIWQIPAAAVISLTLFWAIAVAAQQLTRWLLTHAVGPRSPLSMLFPETAFFAVFIPSMLIAGIRQRKKHAQRKLPRRVW